MKKNIFIKGNIQIDKLKNIKGVEEVVELKSGEYEVKISNKEAIENVFKYVSKCSNVTKFVVEEPSLNEIFIDIVGDSYDK